MSRRYHALGILISVLAGGCGENGTFINNSSQCDGYGDPGSSKYILPYAAGERYTVTQGNCGQVTHYGQIRFAYDFDTQDGDELIAARSGTVHEVVDSNSDDGGSAWSETNYIYIVHADGTMAAYVHIQQNGAQVAEGDTVTQGDVIALSGNSGTLTPHLHFQVYSSATSFRTIPVTFRNAGPNPHGLREGRSYAAEAFTPDSE